MKKKRALIFGITGQDGSYLSRYLIKKNYEVHGVIRKSSNFNTQRIDDIYEDPFIKNKKLNLYYGDLLDRNRVADLICKISPDEIYNLAAQSHVAVSFELPHYTSEVSGLGTMTILDIIKNNDKKIKFYQAGSSEMFGGIGKKYLNEKSNFSPQSPYAASKLFAHNIVKIYRQAYGLHCCNGILFNHESPFRGETFVTQKIVRGLCNIKNKKQSKIVLGNLYAKRDWGHAEDYVEAMWKILNHKIADDYVISTGKSYSVKYFVNLVSKKLNLKLRWIGKGIKEKAYDENNNVIVECHKKYFRPLEVNFLKGDFSKAKKNLNWKPKKNISDLADDMISHVMKEISDN